jgi:hypothetical protein
VELVHAYSNLLTHAETLLQLRVKASSPRPAGGPKRHRQHQRRLRESEVEELIAAYEQLEPVKELAELFGIHRTTVTTILQRLGVELRQKGLSDEQVGEPAASTPRGGRWRDWRSDTTSPTRPYGGICFMREWLCVHPMSAGSTDFRRTTPA